MVSAPGGKMRGFMLREVKVKLLLFLTFSPSSTLCPSSDVLLGVMISIAGFRIESIFLLS